MIKNIRSKILPLILIGVLVGISTLPIHGATLNKEPKTISKERASKTFAKGAVVALEEALNAQSEEKARIEAETAKKAEEERIAAEEAKKKQEEADRIANLSVSNPSALQQGLGAYIEQYGISYDRAAAYGGYFVEAGNSFGVDPIVLVAMAQRESRFHSDAVGGGGSYIGMMQTTSGWAAKIGYSGSDLYDPRISIMAGGKALASGLNQFGNYRDGISAYAYGNGSVASGNFIYGHADNIISIKTSIEAFLISNGYV